MGLILRFLKVWEKQKAVQSLRPATLRVIAYAKAFMQQTTSDISPDVVL